MSDPEAAPRAPPVAVAPPPPTPRTAAAEAKAALGDAVVYCFLAAMFVGCAASIALIVARYTVGGGYPYASAVAAAKHVFLLAFLAVEMFLPFTILVLVLRLARRQPEPPEELLVLEGVHFTVQVHGLEHPAARGGRQGTGYGLIPLLLFVVFSMFMLLGLLMQERSPSKDCCGQTDAEAFISDMGGFVCSVMVIFTFIPHVLIQLRNMPR